MTPGSSRLQLPCHRNALQCPRNATAMRNNNAPHPGCTSIATLQNCRTTCNAAQRSQCSAMHCSRTAIASQNTATGLQSLDNALSLHGSKTAIALQSNACGRHCAETAPQPDDGTAIVQCLDMRYHHTDLARELHRNRTEIALQGTAFRMQLDCNCKQSIQSAIALQCADTGISFHDFRTARGYTYHTLRFKGRVEVVVETHRRCPRK